MSAISQDSWLLSIRPQLERITAAAYEALPEDICRAIEIVDGYIVYCEAPSPAHQTAARRLANLIERYTRTITVRGDDCFTVNTDADLRLRDVPLLNRRPDVILYRCLERGERLRAEHTVLVIEIISPGSETVDAIDKFGEYARAGIPHYWIARLDDTGVSTIERYQLDWATSSYKHVGTAMKAEPGDAPTVTSPLTMTLDWQDLEL
jgi:Uma2 family endonuclease